MSKKISSNSNFQILSNDNVTKTMNFIKKSNDPKYLPLKKQDEIDLLNKYLYTDLDTLKELMFCHHIRYVFQIAGKYYHLTQSYDDCVSMGYQGLMKAVENFDYENCSLISKSNKQIKFATYATFWIRKFILLEFYDKHSKVSMVSLDKLLTDSDAKSDKTFENYYMGLESGNKLENQLSDISDSFQISTDTINTVIQNEHQQTLYSDICSYVKTDVDTFEKYDYDIFSKLFLSTDKKPSVRELSISMKLPIGYINTRKKHIIQNIRNMLRVKYNITSLNDIF